MAEYIKLEDAIAIIEEKQKELCPVGRYGRGYVYGTDREKYDSWDEIIDALENVPSADVAPVMHGRWENGDSICPVCGKDKFKDLDADIWCDWKPDYCPNCGARMDGGDGNAAD